MLADLPWETTIKEVELDLKASKDRLDIETIALNVTYPIQKWLTVAETIQWALHLGVNVKMITIDKLAIDKEVGRWLGMRTNMYVSSSLLG